MRVFRRAAVAAACLSAISSVHALSLSEFGKVLEGNGKAIDLNDSNVVLLQEDSAGFVLLDLAQGVRQTITLSSGLQAQGYTSITVRDINNLGHVSGVLNGAATSGFVWSASTGFTLCPSGYCDHGINDDGLATSVQGFWSQQAGSTDAPVPGYLSGFNNLAQRGFIVPPVAGPQSSISGDAVVGVLSREGSELWSARFAVSASSTADPNYAQAMPDFVVLNDQGLAAVSFDGVKAYSSWTNLYQGGTFLARIVGAVCGMNNRGQMVAGQNLNALSGSGPYYVTSSESIDLGGLVGILPLTRINDSGVILQDRGTTFAILQGPNLSGRPSLPVVDVPPTVPEGTGLGLQGDYFNVGLFGNKLVTTRIENPDFDWGLGGPAPGVYANAFVVRWTGFIQAEETGVYELRTVSDEGVRVTLDGSVVIDHWRSHRTATDTSAGIELQAGQRYPIVIDYYDILGNATMRLSWRKPGASDFTTVPTGRLYQP